MNHAAEAVVQVKTERQKERRTRLLLLLALFAASLFIFRKYLFGNLVLVFTDIGSDTYQLYTLQFASIINHLREGNFALWDFTNGFGVNQFNLNLFDPSLMIVYVLGYFLGPDRVLYYLVVVQILRILAAGWAFYHFLSCFSFSRQAKFAAAFCYGLCGYLMVWGQHYQFGMAVVYLPLLLMFMEKYLQGRPSGRFLPVMVCLSGIYSCFFSYMSLATVGLYLLLRVLMEDDRTLRQRIGRFAGGCLRIILGLVMSMAVFLPMAMCMVGVSGRVNGGGGLAAVLRELFSPMTSGFYESVFLRLFSSNLQITYGLSDEWFEPWKNFYEDPALFCSALAILLDVQLLFVFWKQKLSRRKKIIVYVTAALIVIGIVTPVFGTIYNAFSYYATRFFYVMIPFLLLGAAWMWDYLKEGGRLVKTALVLSAAAMAAAYVIGYRQSIFRELRINAVVLLITGLAMAVCLLLLEKSNEERKKLLFGVLLGFLMVHVCSDGAACYEVRSALRKTDTPAEELSAAQKAYDEARTSGDDEREAYASLSIPQGYFGALYNPNIQDAIAYLEETDPEFFRMEKDFISASEANDSMAQGYYGVSSYNSVMNYYIKRFVQKCAPALKYHRYYPYYLRFAECPEDSQLAAFLGVRYLLSRDDSLPKSKYEPIGSFGDLYLYRTRGEAAMGRFYDRSISEKRFISACKSESTRKVAFFNVISIPGTKDDTEWSELMEKTEAQKESTVTLRRPQKDSLIEGEVHAAADGWVQFMIPYENGWHVFVDGEETELLRSDVAFCACEVKAGDHSLTLRFEAPGLRAGILLSAAGWIVYVLLLLSGPLIQKKKIQATKM